MVYNKILNEIREYLDINEGSVANNTVWEAAKAFIRGIIIKYTAIYKKGIRKKVQELEHEAEKYEKKCGKPQREIIKNG